MESFMSDYFITQITASDKRGNRLVDELLTSERIRKDGNLDYTCGMYDDEMNLIATGSCFGNTLRCMAVSHEHQGEGLMNSIVRRRSVRGRGGIRLRRCRIE